MTWSHSGPAWSGVESRLITGPKNAIRAVVELQDRAVSVFGAMASIGAKVDARCTFTMVQIFTAAEAIATHPARTAGKQTDMSHYLPEKIAFAI